MGTVYCCQQANPKQQQLSSIDILRDLDNLTFQANFTQYEYKYQKHTHLLYAIIGDKLEVASKFHFIDQFTAAIEWIKLELDELMKNHYIPLIEAKVSESIIDRSIVKLLLNCYFTACSLNNSESKWYDEGYFYGRRKLLTNYFEVTPQFVENSIAAPIVNFIYLLTKCVDKLLLQNGLIIKRETTLVVTGSDRFYQNLQVNLNYPEN